LSQTIEYLNRELELLDPVPPGELEGALETADATALLERILALEVAPEPAQVEAGGPPRRDGRSRAARGPRPLRAPHPTGPRRAVAALALAGLGAAAVLLLIVGKQGDGGGQARLTGALDRAALVAASQARPAAAQPFTYLKTRELSVRTTDRDQRTWSVFQRATRQEWVAWDGSGRLRVATGPTRFVAAADRSAWEAAGRPDFLALGFNPRTEERWVESGMLDRRVEELPTNPAVLATQLRDEARGARGESVPAAMLQTIAEDLRNPAASPELRSALYEAALHVPGIEYLGAKSDPEGRAGVAVGVTSDDRGGAAVNTLIFDPRTSRVLATETASPGRGGPHLMRAMVYLASRGADSAAEHGGDWLSGFAPANAGQPHTPFLVYRIERGEPWPTPQS